MPSSFSLLLSFQSCKAFSLDAIEFSFSENIHPRSEEFGEVVTEDVLKEGVEGNEGECARREETVLMYFLAFFIWTWLLWNWGCHWSSLH